MHVEELLPLIPGNKKRSGAGWMAHCPAHQDDTPSLSIMEKDGRILLKCFGGCNFGDIISKLGLRPSDMFTEPLSKSDTNKSANGLIDKKEVERYKYEVMDDTAEGGWRTTGWKIRYEYYDGGKKKKTFGWLNADGTATAPKEKTLYNYRAVTENFREIVYIVEGEKDVNRMTELGMVAICPPDGCGSWSDRFTDLLDGATVRIIPDYDEPGLKAGLMIEEKLRNAGIPVSIHPLTMLRTGKDVSDYKKASKINIAGIKRKSREEIEKMIKRKQKHEESSAKFGDTIQKRVDEWLEDATDSFSTYILCNEIDARTASEKRAVRDYLNLLATEGHIDRDKGKNGQFRKPESELELMDWESVDGTKSNLWLPLDIHKQVDIMPGNIIVIAGQGNAGKSMMCKKIAIENLRLGFPIYYFNSESLEVEIFNSIIRDFGRKIFDEFVDYKKKGLFKMVKRSGNFHEVIRPHALNIIDFLEIHDNFAEAGSFYKKIHDNLGDGLCIVCQQLRTYRDKNGKQQASGYGVGGEATAEKSRLYMNLTNGENYRDYQIEIRKAKMWPQDMPNPNFKKIKFEWKNGEYVEKFDVVNTNNRW